MKKENFKRKSVLKAGHRSWAARNAPVQGKHTGDIMSAEKRSRLMARIKNKNTKPELIVCELLRSRNIEFHKHLSELPGRPDIVLKRERVAVFVDGDFWHGWRFPLWKHKLSEQWRNKIDLTRKRDQMNFRKLRKLNWKVLRLWEHKIERSPNECIEMVLNLRSKHLNVI